jgi:hypothetical protein
MVVTSDPRTPYREESRNLFREPRSLSATSDIASAFWIVIAAALAGGFLIWLLFATSVHVPDSVDPNTRPSVEQPITPPAPVPATRPAPTP